SDGAIADSVDVADLESEQAHEYALAGARDGEQMVRDDTSPAGAPVADGGRANRFVERFAVRLRPGVRARGIVRFDAPPGALLHVFAGGEPVATVFGVEPPDPEEPDAPDDEWVERSFDIPAGVAGPHTVVEIRVSGGPATVFHYWFVETS
ncbi:MAG: hypothetical protein FWD17_14880, partial [Polyangiaceae bacterium]|nr:hypothetical protein [Polyangiaceae bacterium]